MVFTLPDVLLDKKSSVTRSNQKVLPNSVQFSIYGVVVPQVAVPDVKVPYGGQTMKVTSYARPSYEVMDVNFMVDNMFNNYWVIYQWLNVLNDDMRSIYNSQLPNDSGKLSKYNTTITVYGLDEYNKRVIQFNYYNAFPTLLGGIKYSDRDPSEMESNFSYSFSQFEPILL